MSKTYNVPMNYKKGVYNLKDFEKNTEETIELTYDEEWEIVRYDLPEEDDGKTMTFYSIPIEVLENTLKATYDENGHLKMMNIQNNGKEELIYIYYESLEEAKGKISQFALENANRIIERIGTCKDCVSRLFIEYFNDGEYIDFHAKLGTKEQKLKLEEKYPDCSYTVDSCGDYDSEFIEGDNKRLKVMVACAEYDEFDAFMFAVDIMKECVQKKAVELLDKAEDFRFLCDVYD